MQSEGPMALNNIFERAFHDEEMQKQFFFELLLNDIFIIADSDLDGIQLKEGDNLRVFSIQHEGVSYVPIFLSIQSLETFLRGNETSYVKANAADLLETLKENNIVINPGQEESIVLYEDEVKEVLQQGLH